MAKDLSNYSMQDLIQEWIMDRARGPLLLQRAVELDGLDAVVAFAVAQGVPKGTIMFALRRAGCIQAPEREADADPFRTKALKLWKQNPERLMSLVEELYRGR